MRTGGAVQDNTRVIKYEKWKQSILEDVVGFGDADVYETWHTPPKRSSQPVIEDAGTGMEDSQIISED